MQILQYKRVASDDIYALKWQLRTQSVKILSANFVLTEKCHIILFQSIEKDILCFCWLTRIFLNFT